MTTMHDVESTNIAAIGYDELQKELHVRFRTSACPERLTDQVRPGTYVYHDVPRDVFEALMRYDSKGSFLNRMIKGNYEFTKLEAAPPDLLTITMTRPIFVQLQQLIARHTICMALTETAPGVVVLEVIPLQSDVTSKPKTDLGGKLSRSQE